MSEVYWITGGTVLLESANEYPGAALEWLRLAGIQPGWISEIQWLSAPGIQGPAPRWPDPLAAFTWTAQPLLDQALLHAACHAILSEELDMVLLGASEADQAHLLVLGSPKAVGGHNLLPHARLPLRVSLPVPENALPDLPAALEPLLKKLEFSVEDISMTAVCGEGDALPERWQRITTTSGCALAQCNALVSALEANDGKLGLLAGLPSEGTALLTLVERI